MSDAQHHRNEADELPDGDVVAVLLRQHADITDAMERVQKSKGDDRVTNFAALKQFLAAHETAEQKVVRPVAREIAGQTEADERTAEEKDADAALAELTSIGADSPEFGPKFAEFMKAVSTHAENEEHDEFPLIQKSRSDAQRVQLGQEFLAAFAKA